MRYDTIVIGSGISGLTAATLLAKVRGEKVLLLEQHNILGGFTHTFRRGRFEWDTGLHYVGNMGPKDFPRRVMDFVTNKQVDWLKMPETFEKFHFPKFTFAQRSGERAFIDDLKKQFPADESAIEKYFADLLKAQIWGTLHFAAQVLPFFLAWIPRVIAWPRRRWGKIRLGDYFAQNIRNKDLAALLAAPCGDYGLAPSEASLFIHALIVRHYLTGGYYPAGGSKALPQSVGDHMRELGVEVRTRATAEEILLEGGRVTGVRIRHRGQSEDLLAKKVISCVGAKQTYLNLLKRPSKTAEALKKFPTGMTMATVYLGLKSSPTELGFGGENHWLFATTDFERMHQMQELPDGEVQGCYISFPSLKDRGAANHTVEILVPANFAKFAELSQGGWGRRGVDYNEAKKELARKVLAFVENKFPGFQNLIETTEVSTPLSIDHFTHHAFGEVYGLPATTERYRLKGLGPRTKIKGLYLAGADVLAHGIVGAMMSGLCAVTACGKGRDVYKLFKQILA